MLSLVLNRKRNSYAGIVVAGTRNADSINCWLRISSTIILGVVRAMRHQPADDERHQWSLSLGLDLDPRYYLLRTPFSVDATRFLRPNPSASPGLTRNDPKSTPCWIAV